MGEAEKRRRLFHPNRRTVNCPECNQIDGPTSKAPPVKKPPASMRVAFIIDHNHPRSTYQATATVVNVQPIRAMRQNQDGGEGSVSFL